MGLHSKTRCLHGAIYHTVKSYDIHFKFAHVLTSVMSVQVDKMDPSLPNSMPMDLLDATEDSSLCNSMPTNLLSLLSVIDRLRLRDSLSCQLA